MHVKRIGKETTKKLANIISFSPVQYTENDVAMKQTICTVPVLSHSRDNSVAHRSTGHVNWHWHTPDPDPKILFIQETNRSRIRTLIKDIEWIQHYASDRIRDWNHAFNKP